MPFTGDMTSTRMRLDIGAGRAADSGPDKSMKGTQVELERPPTTGDATND